MPSPCGRIRRLAIIPLILVAVFVTFVPAIGQEASPDPATSANELKEIDEFLSDLSQPASTTDSASSGTTELPAGDHPAEAASDSWIPLPVISRPSEAPEVGKTVKPDGEGTLQIDITTVREKTPRQISLLPQRIELWTQDRLLASLENGEAGVENAFHKRTFHFSPIPLPAGYYFLTIRGFAEGFVTRERKWKGKILQIGIHNGKITKIHEILPMFVW